MNLSSFRNLAFELSQNIMSIIPMKLVLQAKPTVFNMPQVRAQFPCLEETLTGAVQFGYQLIICLLLLSESIIGPWVMNICLSSQVIPANL